MQLLLVICCPGSQPGAQEPVTASSRTWRLPYSATVRARRTSPRATGGSPRQSHGSSPSSMGKRQHGGVISNGPRPPALPDLGELAYRGEDAFVLRRAEAPYEARVDLRDRTVGSIPAAASLAFSASRATLRTSGSKCGGFANALFICAVTASGGEGGRDCRLAWAESGIFFGALDETGGGGCLRPGRTPQRDLVSASS